MRFKPLKIQLFSMSRKLAMWILPVFAMSTVVLAVALNSSLHFYMQLFNEGIITDFEAFLFGTITLIAISIITIFVGRKFILYLKSNSKRTLRIFGSRSGGNFWTGLLRALLIFVVSNVIGGYFLAGYSLTIQLTSIQALGYAIIVSGTVMTGYVIGAIGEKKLSSPNR